MALKQAYDVQPEDIPGTGLQEHYVEKDGKWVVGMLPDGSCAGGRDRLKTASTTERNPRGREAEKTVTDLEVQFEEGVMSSSMTSSRGIVRRRCPDRRRRSMTN